MAATEDQRQMKITASLVMLSCLCGCNSYHMHAGPQGGGIDLYATQFFMRKAMPSIQITVSGDVVTGIMSGYTNQTDGAATGEVVGAAIKAVK